jgi:hypothetical protein
LLYEDLPAGCANDDLAAFTTAATFRAAML